MLNFRSNLNQIYESLPIFFNKLNLNCSYQIPENEKKYLVYFILKILTIFNPYRSYFLEALVIKVFYNFDSY